MPSKEASMIPIYVDKKVMEAVQGISLKRAKQIENMMDRNIPAWKKWIMKKFWIVGKTFKYGMKVEPEQPQPGEMIREKITLMNGKTEIDGMHFIVKEKEAPEGLWSMLPKQKWKSEEDKPNYIG